MFKFDLNIVKFESRCLLSVYITLKQRMESHAATNQIDLPQLSLVNNLVMHSFGFRTLATFGGSIENMRECNCSVCQGGVGTRRKRNGYCRSV